MGRRGGSSWQRTKDRGHCSARRRGRGNWNRGNSGVEGEGGRRRNVLGVFGHQREEKGEGEIGEGRVGQEDRAGVASG